MALYDGKPQISDLAEFLDIEPGSGREAVGVGVRAAGRALFAEPAPKITQGGRGYSANSGNVGPWLIGAAAVVALAMLARR